MKILLTEYSLLIDIEGSIVSSYVDLTNINISC